MSDLIKGSPLSDLLNLWKLLFAIYNMSDVFQQFFHNPHLMLWLFDLHLVAVTGSFSVCCSRETVETESSSLPLVLTELLHSSVVVQHPDGSCCASATFPSQRGRNVNRWPSGHGDTSATIWLLSSTNVYILFSAVSMFVLLKYAATQWTCKTHVSIEFMMM